MIDRPAAPPFACRARLSELEECWLEFQCGHCGRSSTPAIKLIIRRFGGHHALGALISRAVCEGCGAKPSAIYLNERHNRLHQGGAPPGWSVQLYPAANADDPKVID